MKMIARVNFHLATARSLPTDDSKLGAFESSHAKSWIRQLQAGAKRCVKKILNFEYQSYNEICL